MSGQGSGAISRRKAKVIRTLRFPEQDISLELARSLAPPSSSLWMSRSGGDCRGIASLTPGFRDRGLLGGGLSVDAGPEGVARPALAVHMHVLTSDPGSRALGRRAWRSVGGRVVLRHHLTCCSHVGACFRVAASLVMRMPRTQVNHAPADSHRERASANNRVGPTAGPRGRLPMSNC